jgi:hypothetical protein
MLDLDKARTDREAERAKAAQREGAATTVPVIWCGREIAVLDAELPLEALSPLLLIDAEITLLLRQAMSMTGGKVDADTTGLVIDLLTTSPDLPAKVLDVARQMAVAVLGEDGLGAFLAGRPSAQDAAALAKGLFAHFGISLGEASGSGGSPETAGPTSKATSDGITTSTPVEPGDVPALTAS